MIESRIPKPRSGSAAGSTADTVQGAAKLTKNAVEGSAVSSTSSTRSGSRGRKRPGSAPKKPKEELEKGWVDVVEPPPEADEEAVLPSPEVAGEHAGMYACPMLLDDIINTCKDGRSMFTCQRVHCGRGACCRS